MVKKANLIETREEARLARRSQRYSDQRSNKSQERWAGTDIIDAYRLAQQVSKRAETLEGTEIRLQQDRIAHWLSRNRTLPIMHCP